MWYRTFRTPLAIIAILLLALAGTAVAGMVVALLKWGIGGH